MEEEKEKMKERKGNSQSNNEAVPFLASCAGFLFSTNQRNRGP